MQENKVIKEDALDFVFLSFYINIGHHWQPADGWLYPSWGGAVKFLNGHINAAQKKFSGKPILPPIILREKLLDINQKSLFRFFNQSLERDQWFLVRYNYPSIFSSIFPLSPFVGCTLIEKLLVPPNEKMPIITFILQILRDGFKSLSNYFLVRTGKPESLLQVAIRLKSSNETLVKIVESYTDDDNQLFQGKLTYQDNNLQSVVPSPIIFAIQSNHADAFKIIFESKKANCSEAIIQTHEQSNACQYYTQTDLTCDLTKQISLSYAIENNADTVVKYFFSGQLYKAYEHQLHFGSRIKIANAPTLMDCLLATRKAILVKNNLTKLPSSKNIIKFLVKKILTVNSTICNDSLLDDGQVSDKVSPLTENIDSVVSKTVKMLCFSVLDAHKSKQSLDVSKTLIEVTRALCAQARKEERSHKTRHLYFEMAKWLLAYHEHSDAYFNYIYHEYCSDFIIKPTSDVQLSKAFLQFLDANFLESLLIDKIIPVPFGAFKDAANDNSELPLASAWETRFFENNNKCYKQRLILAPGLYQAPAATYITRLLILNNETSVLPCDGKNSNFWERLILTNDKALFTVFFGAFIENESLHLFAQDNIFVKAGTVGQDLDGAHFLNIIVHHQASNSLAAYFELLNSSKMPINNVMYNHCFMQYNFLLTMLMNDDLNSFKVLHDFQQHYTKLSRIFLNTYEDKTDELNEACQYNGLLRVSLEFLLTSPSIVGSNILRWLLSHNNKLTYVSAALFDKDRDHRIPLQTLSNFQDVQRANLLITELRKINSHAKSSVPCFNQVVEIKDNFNNNIFHTLAMLNPTEISEEDYLASRQVSVNDEAWYTEQQIKLCFDYYIKKQNQMLEPERYFLKADSLPPFSFYSNKKGVDDFQTMLFQYLENTATRDFPGKLFMPICVKGCHWVLYYILFKTNTKKVSEIFCSDALAGKTNKTIEKILRRSLVFVSDVKINTVNLTSVTCGGGTWIIEAAKMLMNAAKFPGNEINIEQAKRQHAGIINLPTYVSYQQFLENTFSFFWEIHEKGGHQGMQALYNAASKSNKVTASSPGKSPIELAKNIANGTFTYEFQFFLCRLEAHQKGEPLFINKEEREQLKAKISQANEQTVQYPEDDTQKTQNYSKQIYEANKAHNDNMQTVIKDAHSQIFLIEAEIRMLQEQLEEKNNTKLVTESGLEKTLQKEREAVNNRLRALIADREPIIKDVATLKKKVEYMSKIVNYQDLLLGDKKQKLQWEELLGKHKYFKRFSERFLASVNHLAIGYSAVASGCVAPRGEIEHRLTKHGVEAVLDKLKLGDVVQSKSQMLLKSLLGAAGAGALFVSVIAVPAGLVLGAAVGLIGGFISAFIDKSLINNAKNSDTFGLVTLDKIMAIGHQVIAQFVVAYSYQLANVDSLFDALIKEDYSAEVIIDTLADLLFIQFTGVLFEYLKDYSQANSNCSDAKVARDVFDSLLIKPFSLSNSHELDEYFLQFSDILGSVSGTVFSSFKTAGGWICELPKKILQGFRNIKSSYTKDCSEAEAAAMVQVAEHLGRGENERGNERKRWISKKLLGNFYTKKYCVSIGPEDRDIPYFYWVSEVSVQQGGVQSTAAGGLEQQVNDETSTQEVACPIPSSSLPPAPLSPLKAEVCCIMLDRNTLNQLKSFQGNKTERPEGLEGIDDYIKHFNQYKHFLPLFTKEQGSVNLIRGHKAPNTVEKKAIPHDGGELKSASETTEGQEGKNQIIGGSESTNVQAQIHGLSDKLVIESEERIKLEERVAALEQTKSNNDSTTNKP